MRATVIVVTDVEVVCLARALRVSTEALLPKGSEVTETLRAYFPERPLRDVSSDVK